MWEGGLSKIMNSEGVGVGVMAVIAVSGGVLYAALKAHQQLVSDFKKQLKREMDTHNHQHSDGTKIKRVTFADDVLEPSSDNKAYRKRGCKMSSQVDQAPAANEEECGDRPAGIPEDMPLNRVALYKGIREDRVNRGILH